MPRALVILAAVLIGYAAGGVLGYAIVMGASANTHDKPVEAAMTAVFVTGPVLAVLAGVIALRWGRRKPR